MISFGPVSDRWLEENFGTNNASWKDVFAMVFHFRYGSLIAWIPLKKFTLADWRLAWCFQFLVESGCGFGHFWNSFGEFVFMMLAISGCGQQYLQLSCYCKQCRCILQQFFIYIFAVGVYLFTDECILSYIYIYMMMACGKWFSKEGVEIFTYPGCHFTAMRTFASFW